MIEFKSTRSYSRFNDPRVGFDRVAVPCEIRVDPLTGTRSRIAHLGIPPRSKGGLPSSLSENASAIFAPPLVSQVTPTFPRDFPDLPEARITRGRSVLFPNLNPYDTHSPVVAIGERTYVEGDSLDPADLTDALILLRQFFSRLPPRVAASGVVGWNLLPAAGSSIPHPHLQAIASGRTPDRQRQERLGELRHTRRTGGDFWEELVASERSGPRWLGSRRNWSAMMAFAPKTIIPDALVVHRSAASLLDAGDAALGGLADWVCRLAAAHHAEGIYSFNLILHPTGPPTGRPSRLRARFLPRISVVESTHSSDLFWVNLGTDEGLAALTPEEWTQTIRPRLG